MRGARAGACRKPSAGSRRCSTTIRSRSPARRRSESAQASRIGPLRRGRDARVDVGADRVVADGVAPIDQVLLITVFHAREPRRNAREWFGEVGRARKAGFWAAAVRKLVVVR